MYRRFLTLVLAAGLIGLVGCSGSSTGNGEPRLEGGPIGAKERPLPTMSGGQQTPDPGTKTGGTKVKGSSAGSKAD